jgi:hypothetical protein
MSEHNIKEIEVKFSKGSFKDFCERNGETSPDSFVDEWEANYNTELENIIKEQYPGVNCWVGEGYDQMHNVDINIILNDEFLEFELDDDLEYINFVRDTEEKIQDLLDDPIDLDGDICTVPTIEAVSKAIEDGTSDKPIYKLDYAGASFVFGRVYDESDKTFKFCWADLDVETDILADDVDWAIGDLESAAIAFKSEFDEDFQLITQTEASKIADVSIGAIANAIASGKIRAYRKNKSRPHTPGCNLVSLSEVQGRWGNE